MRRALLAGLAAGLLGGPAGAHDRQAGPGPHPDFPIAFGGPFSLVDQDGVPRTDQDFRGRFLLVFFGYTQCPDICPTDLQTMAAALDILGDAAERVQPLFISVDPARDTQRRLKAFVARFHPRLVGLTGSEGQVRAAARAYRVHRFKVVPADSSGPDDYLASHSSITYLMGPDGSFLTLFPHDTTAESMATAIRRYLS